MLDASRVAQVAGDQEGRFFEGIDDQRNLLRGHGDHVVEAYHWGRATSGSAASALWFLLAPFGIVNAAGFMLPAPQGRASRRAAAVARAALRFLGLGLTVLLTLAVAVVFLDLWAWQQPGGPRRWTSAAALVGSTALPVGCFFLARRPPGTRRTGDRNASDQPEVMPDSGPATTGSEFTRPGFLDGDPDAPVLRALHLAAGLLSVAAVGTGLLPDGVLSTVLLVLAILALVAVAAIVLLLGDGDRSAFWVSLAFWGALVVGVMFLAAVLTSILTGDTVAQYRQHLPTIEIASVCAMSWCAAAWALTTLANVVVAIGSSALTVDHEDRFRPFARGMSATLVTGLAVYVAVGYSGAVGTAAVQLLPGSARVPDMLSRAVYAWGLLAVMVILASVVAAISITISAPRRRADQAKEPFRSSLVDLPSPWINQIARSIAVARLKNHLVGPLTGLTLIGVVLSFFAGWEGLQMVWTSMPSPPDWLSLVSYAGADIPAGKFPVWFSNAAMNLGAWFSGLVAASLLVLGRTAALNGNKRRGLNVIWDVIAFWPRSAHPFVPLPYAPATETRLAARLRWHLLRRAEPRPTDVVLCAHSQGSLISFATLLRQSVSLETKPVPLDRLGLLTFGSQLQVIFSRAFPCYVNKRSISYLYTVLGGRWINLYRDTDHVAGPVLSWKHGVRPADTIRGSECPKPSLIDGRLEYGPDWRLVDPPLPDAEFQEKPLRKLRKHSEYWSDPAWDDALAAVRPCRAPAEDSAVDGLESLAETTFIGDQSAQGPKGTARVSTADGILDTGA